MTCQRDQKPRTSAGSPVIERHEIGCPGREPRKPLGELAHPPVLQREMPCGRVSLRVRGREHDGSQALSVRPREAPRAPVPLGRTSLCANVTDGHGLDPVGQRVVLQAHCLSRIKFLRAPENRVAVPGGLTVRCDLANHGVDLGVQVLRPGEGIDVESIEHLSGLRRIEDVLRSCRRRTLRG